MPGFSCRAQRPEAALLDALVMINVIPVDRGQMRQPSRSERPADLAERGNSPLKVARVPENSGSDDQV